MFCGIIQDQQPVPAWAGGGWREGLKALVAPSVNRVRRSVTRIEPRRLYLAGFHHAQLHTERLAARGIDERYSNKTRGQMAQRQPSAKAAVLPVAPSPTAREARKGWAALIKQVYEADPLSCPKCGATMRMVAFIERHQTEVIEKILRHCGLWEDAPARGPPAPAGVTVER